MLTQRIKLYGERNTGTRYLTRLFEHNLNSGVIRGVAPRWATWVQAIAAGKDSFRDFYFERTFPGNFGWKHCQVSIDRLLHLGDAISDVHFVTLVKNPYSWLLSLDKRSYHQKLEPDGARGLEALVTKQWRTVGRENGPAFYRDAVDLWNYKVSSYLALAEHFPTTVLTYEALVDDPAQALDKIRLASDNTWKQGGFENLPESTKEQGKDSSYYRDYYGNERWRSKLTDDVVALINTRLDRELMSAFAYHVLEP